MTKSEFIQAAQDILAESDRPLSSGEIVEIARLKGLIGNSKGKTPERTMYEKLLRNSDGKGKSYFVRQEDGSGKFTLSTEYRQKRPDGKFLGLGGEHFVMSELFFRKFIAMPLSLDEGMDIIAEKNGKSFKFQVKTKNKDSRGRYIIHIGVEAFERFRKEKNIFFVLLLRESRVGPTKTIIMPSGLIQDLIEERNIPVIGKDKGLYRLEFRLKDEKVYLRQKEMSTYLGNWDIIR